MVSLATGDRAHDPGPEIEPKLMLAGLSGEYLVFWHRRVELKWRRRGNGDVLGGECMTTGQGDGMMEGRQLSFLRRT